MQLEDRQATLQATLENLRSDQKELLARLSRNTILLARFDWANKDRWSANGRPLFDVLTNQNEVEFDRWKWSELLEPVKESLTASLQDIYKAVRDEKSGQAKQKLNALSLLKSFGNPPQQEVKGLVVGMVWIEPGKDLTSGKEINEGFYLGKFEITQGCQRSLNGNMPAGQGKSKKSRTEINFKKWLFLKQTSQNT